MRERYKGGLPGIDDIWGDDTALFVELDMNVDKEVLGKQIAGSVLDNFEQAGVNCFVIKAKKQILEEAPDAARIVLEQSQKIFGSQR